MSELVLTRRLGSATSSSSPRAQNRRKVHNPLPQPTSSHTHDVATGESRTDLIGKNKSILQSALSDMQPFGPNTILLLVANPVDVITYFAQQYSNLPKTRVLGSGTFLDSARLRGALAKEAGVAASSVNAYVLGEHGESQFVAWSRCSIGGLPLEIALPKDVKIDEGRLEEETKAKAGKIIESKGATNYGIGGVVARLCRSILFDEREAVCVSSWQEELGVCLSLPVVLGREGVVRGVEMGLSKEEEGKLRKSAEAIKEVIEA